MTEYVAKHYIPLKGGMLTPGEIIRDLPEDVIPRLKAKGAIEEIAPVAAAEDIPDEAEPEEAEEIIEAGEEPEEKIEIDALDGVVTDAKPAKKTRKKKEG